MKELKLSKYPSGTSCPLEIIATGAMPRSLPTPTPTENRRYPEWPKPIKNGHNNPSNGHPPKLLLNLTDGNVFTMELNYIIK